MVQKIGFTFDPYQMIMRERKATDPMTDLAKLTMGTMNATRTFTKASIICSAQVAATFVGTIKTAVCGFYTLLLYRFPAKFEAPQTAEKVTALSCAEHQQANVFFRLHGNEWNAQSLKMQAAYNAHAAFSSLPFTNFALQLPLNLSEYQAYFSSLPQTVSEEHALPLLMSAQCPGHIKWLNKALQLQPKTFPSNFYPHFAELFKKEGLPPPSAEYEFSAEISTEAEESSPSFSSLLLIALLASAGFYSFAAPSASPSQPPQKESPPIPSAVNVPSPIITPDPTPTASPSQPPQKESSPTPSAVKHVPFPITTPDPTPTASPLALESAKPPPLNPPISQTTKQELSSFFSLQRMVEIALTLFGAGSMIFKKSAKNAAPLPPTTPIPLTPRRSPNQPKDIDWDSEKATEVELNENNIPTKLLELEDHIIFTRITQAGSKSTFQNATKIPQQVSYTFKGNWQAIAKVVTYVAFDLIPSEYGIEEPSEVFFSFENPDKKPRIVLTTRHLNFNFLTEIQFTDEERLTELENPKISVTKVLKS